MEREERYARNEWDDKADYLADAWILRHNDDYLSFLVEKVWKIRRPSAVVDFGCGSGRFGAKLMAHLPGGSTYHGFDLSTELIAQARRRWPHEEIEAEFCPGSVYDAPFPGDRFDVATAHTVLMHIPDPRMAIAEMIRVTREGGLVVTCDANRTASSALFHIPETGEQATAPLGPIQTMNGAIRERTGVDHDIGVKTPVLMHQAGLRNVGARMSDSMRLLFPPIDSDQGRVLFRALCREGFAPPGADREAWIAGITRHGVSREDAERMFERELARDFANRAGEYHTVYTDLLSFSFGTVGEKERQEPEEPGRPSGPPSTSRS
jgi:SAM-dependent methyltransferase